MKTVIAKVKREVGEKNFSCYMKVESVNAAVLGQGNTARAAIADMLQGWKDTMEDLKNDGIEVPAISIEYAFDIGALFNYYDFLNVSGISREIGISSAVMKTEQGTQGADYKRNQIACQKGGYGKYMLT